MDTAEARPMRAPRFLHCLTGIAAVAFVSARASEAPVPADLAPYFRAPTAFAGKLDERRSPLLRPDGTKIATAAEWERRRAEIRREWFALMGPWPELLSAPTVERVKSEQRDNVDQHSVRLEIAAGVLVDAYLLVPRASGPHPAVVVPYYEPDTSVGRGQSPLRDYGLQLARRGFVTLCLGSPPRDAIARAPCQPLSFMAYIAANCHTALARQPEVDARRIGIVGHSYGGKWALFALALHDKFACAVWSDPGIVFDETRGNINYWEPWYLGFDPAVTRERGKISPTSPRTGAYKRMMEQGRDLHELHALMAPRPFLVSGGAEDPVGRWASLNHAVAVNRLLGFEHRVAMHNRPAHGPTEEANEVVYRFFEHFLRPSSSN